MKTMVLVSMLLYLVVVSSAPARKEAECRDQYGHCPEWSKAGYCNKTGYETYMTLMCAHSCNTCNVLKQTKDSKEEDVSSASGLEDSQLNNSIDNQETIEGDEDISSANKQTIGEDAIELQSGSDGHDVKGEATPDEEDNQNKQSKDTSLELKNNPKQSLKRQQRKSVSVGNKDSHDVTRERTKEKKMATQDRDPQGVEEVTFQDNTDDEVNPRSNILTPPENNPSKGTSETPQESQDKEITVTQNEDLSGSGTLDESGESMDKETNIASPKVMVNSSHDKITESTGKSEEVSEEMKDIAGDIKTGSKIFEADISEPESTSGCSSGFGCFSGNGEQRAQSDKGEESMELERRSKIEVVPYKKVNIHSDSGHGTHQDIKSKSEAKSDVDQEVDGGKSAVSDFSSGSGEEVKDDIQSIDKVAEGESIDGAKSVAKSATFSKSEIDSNTESKPSVNSQSEAKRDEDTKVDEQKLAARDPSSGSGAEVRDDIQNIDKVDEGESIDGAKSVAKSATFSKSEMDSNTESKPSVKSQSEAKRDEDTKVDGQKLAARDPSSGSGAEVRDDIQSIDEGADEENIDSAKSAIKSDTLSGSGTDTTAKSEPPNENKSVAKSDVNQEVDEQKSAVKDHVFSGSGAELRDGNQSIDEGADEEDHHGDKSVIKSETAQTEATEGQDIEDALFPKEDDMANDDKGSGVGSGQPENAINEDLSSPKTRQRLTSMEKLITDDKQGVEKVKDVPGNARENVPHEEEAVDDFIASDIGRGRKVTLILDQHYYKPYSNEDSMAYEMLALDLKKEVERAVGNQAIVSQISFSEIQKPGKLPRYSRVLAKFTLHGSRKVLHNAVRKGLVGDMMVDKNFFRSL